MPRAQLLMPGLMPGKKGGPYYLAYDSFTRADGPLGDSEASGPLGAATIRAWNAADFAITGGRVFTTGGRR